MADPIDQLTALPNLQGILEEEKDRRITLWNRIEQRKISGTAAPLRKNLAKYLRKNPQCEVSVGQNRFCALQPGDLDRKTGKRVAHNIGRVAIWNKIKKKLVSGSACPLRKNIALYLLRNPHLEIYAGQDKDGYHAPGCEFEKGPNEGTICVKI